MLYFAAITSKGWSTHMKAVEILQEAAVSLSGNDGALVSTRLGFNPSDAGTVISGSGRRKAQTQKKTRSGVAASHRKENYSLGCSNKTRFKSLEHAKEAKGRIRYIAAMESADGKAASRLPSRAYACGNCKGWHLSSRPDRFEVLFELAA
jgi:hypothetical protein